MRPTLARSAFSVQRSAFRSRTRRVLFEDFLQSKYVDVVSRPRTDLRIFLGSNLAAFLAVAVCSYFYVFEQNWFFTIIYGDYVGFAYAAYLGSVFLFLIDVVLNRARVTIGLLNWFFELIGSSVSVAPC